MTPEEALAFVRERRVVPFTDVKGGPESFVHAVTGGPVKGSWWGHPKGREIFNLAGAVAGECIALKLIAGKETLVHRALHAALARVVTDEAWRRPRIAALSKPGRALLASVEKEGPRRVVAADRRELERALLVHVEEEHTESGHHATVVVPWKRWVSPELAKAAKKLTLEVALAELRGACGGAKTALD